MNQKERWEQLKKGYNNQENLKTEEFVEEEQEVKRPMTEDEKQNVKKQMMILIWGIIIIIFGYVIINVIVNMVNKEENIVVEEPEEPKETLPDGEIATTNAIVQEINKMFTFDIRNPLYEANILKLFNNKKVEIDNLDFQAKMLLITSNSIFNDYMLNETNLKDYKTKEVSLTKEKLEELSKEIFGRDINLEHNNFKYYYVSNNDVIYFNAEFKNNKYIFTKTTGKPSTIEVYKELVSVYKISNEVSLQYRIVFIKNNKIYSDANITKIISNSINNINNIVYSGDIYEYVYNIDLEKNNIYFLNYIKKNGSSEEK